jgi:methylmalonyl-CoA mutase
VAILAPPPEIAARLGFVRNLLAAGGITVEVGDPGDYHPAGTPLAVISGPDERYPTEAAATARALKAAGARKVLLAGRPGSLKDELRAAGVDGFMFAGGDAVDLLERALEAWR